MEIKIEPSWAEILKDEFTKEYFSNLGTKLENAYKNNVVYPPPQQIFNAFNLCPFSEVKVVIIGQDPYHGAGQAEGLAFSVQNGVKFPPSLRNIFKELNSDIGTEIKSDGSLQNWATQGVLLLNTTLTVLEGLPASHQGLGWETFTNKVIETLSKEQNHLVFILWGKSAETKASLINTEKHLIIQSPHPSPLSSHTGFFGSKPFSKTNTYLVQNSLTPIDW